MRTEPHRECDCGRSLLCLSLHFLLRCGSVCGLALQRRSMPCGGAGATFRCTHRSVYRQHGSFSFTIYEVLQQRLDTTGDKWRSRCRRELGSLHSSDRSYRRIPERCLRQQDAAIPDAYAAANHTSITMQHGSSLLSWSGPISAGVLTDGNNALLYPTLVVEGSDPTTSSGEPWLFYLDATTWPDWSAATIMNRRVQLSLQ